MKVPLRELPRSADIALSNEFVREAIAGLALRTALERSVDDPNAGSARAQLELYAGEDSVFANGRLRGWLEIACGRCVGTVRHTLNESINVTFVPKEQVPEDPDEDEEIEVAEDDVDLFPFEGEEVDLEPLLREQLVLAVPYSPLCKKNCLGLCAKCGVNLNETTCTCDRHVVDPRLAALGDIKLGN